MNFFISLLLVHLFVFAGRSAEASQTYLPLTGVRDAERLTILNEVYNSHSITFLKKMGISEGMRVLDVGCGIGLMSYELAELVGPGGHVVCIDTSSEQLELSRLVTTAKGVDNLSFLALSAFELNELDDQFDCIYIRFLLMHVQNPEKILIQAYNKLKPGGKIIVEETTGLDTIKCFPVNQSFQEYLQIGEAQFRLHGTDAAIGCRLSQMLSQMNFKSLSTHLFHPVLQTPREKKLIRLAVDTLTPALVAHGEYLEDEMKEISRKLCDVENHPSYFVTYFELAQVCAEK